jgi:hypothetical protein
MQISVFRRLLSRVLGEAGVATLKVGTITALGSAVTMPATITRTGQVYQITDGAKVGATSGAAVRAADNKNSLARCPAGQTGATIVVPITGLKVGAIITGYSLNGQIEAAGNTATLDCALRKQTAVAADNSDAAVTNGAITQVSTVADVLISSANAAVSGLSETVAAGVTYYLLITITTGASTDVDLLSACITVTEK